MKQLNIFGEIEILNDDGSVRRCEYCRQPNLRESGFCSDECVEKSLDEVLGVSERELKQKTDEKKD